MYDFEGAGANGSAERGSQPSRVLTSLELPRGACAYGLSRTLDAFTPSKPFGAGRPVLVLPGFSANDFMTGRLRGHLRRQGFDVYGWGLGRNMGLTDRLVDGLSQRFTDIAQLSDEPVSVIGWSFGGLLARRLAHEHTEQVRQIICLGSPWRAEGELTRATAMFERARVRHGLSDRARGIVDQLREPVPVPTTAIWSRSDGITAWHGCSVDERTGPPVAENIRVPSSHVGMVASPIVQAVVDNRLAQDPNHWHRFEWRSLLGRGAA